MGSQSIRVAHIRKEAGEIVCRPSPLGNLFSHRPSKFDVVRVSSREEAIWRYRQWLAERLLEPASPQSREMGRLLRILLERGELVLLCWCAPLRCHAEVVREVLLERLAALGVR